LHLKPPRIKLNGRKNGEQHRDDRDHREKKNKTCNRNGQEYVDDDLGAEYVQIDEFFVELLVVSTKDALR
jgi:hypothetical protein